MLASQCQPHGQLRNNILSEQIQSQKATQDTLLFCKTTRGKLKICGVNILMSQNSFCFVFKKGSGCFLYERQDVGVGQKSY